MHIIKRLIISIIFFFINNFFWSQNKDLEKLNYAQLENKIDSFMQNSKNAIPLVNFYINKSKKEKKLENLFYAYRYASNCFSKNIKVQYADSSIIIAKKMNNENILAKGYLNKSILLMDNNDYSNAMKFILFSYKISLKTKDEYLKHLSIYHIAQNYSYLGQLDEAKKEYEKCIKYYRHMLSNPNPIGENNEMMYLYSLMSLIDINSKNLRFSDNKILLNNAFEYVKNNKKSYYIPYFISSEGTDAYYQKNYLKAIKKLKEAQNLYNDTWPHFTEIFYIGLSYWKLNNRTEAVKYFEKLDKEYYKDKNQDPQFRPAYELLIEYYASKNNTDKQLEYINKLMVLDKSYEKNYKYLFAKINKEYDTKKLIDEKNKIENKLKLHQTLTLGIIFFSLLVISFSTFKYFQIQKKYKERFKQIIAEKNSSEITENTTLSEENKAIENKISVKIPGVNDATVENILGQLENFEKENLFLDAKITQKLLSEKIGTNATYLSKTINAYKGKNFNNYVNDLRLDYLLELLKTDGKFLNKDIKELANIAGFSNTEGFSDNFQRKFKIKPSYFIKMMKENIKTSAQLHNPTSNSENV